jgi:hypothetical protein
VLLQHTYCPPPNIMQHATQPETLLVHHSVTFCLSLTPSSTSSSYSNSTVPHSESMQLHVVAFFLTTCLCCHMCCACSVQVPGGSEEPQTDRHCQGSNNRGLCRHQLCAWHLVPGGFSRVQPLVGLKVRSAPAAGLVSGAQSLLAT